MATESLDNLLAETEAILSRLVQVQTDRQKALAGLVPGELERLSRLESEGTDQFAEVLRRRGALLNEVNAALGPGEAPVRTVRELAARLSPSEEKVLRAQLNRIGDLARRLRDLAAENWLVGYRSAQHLQVSIESLMPLAKRSYDQPPVAGGGW